MTTAAAAERSVAIAVDGGGSKTTVVAHDLSAGTILGRAKVGATNPNSVGEEAALAALREGVEGALREAGRTAADVVAVCAGMSGVDRPQDKTKVTQWFRDILHNPALAPAVFNDGTIALSCGTHGVLEGVVVISGTGTISLGYSRKGLAAATAEPRYARAAGWGPVLGDDGSGYDIGARTLKAAVFAEDGRGPETAICAELQRTLGLTSMQELIRWAYDKATFSWQKIADVAPVAIRCAAAGDTVAKKILEAAADGLLVSITAVARRLGYTAEDSFPIVYAGGILSSGALAPYLTPRIASAFPKATVLQPDVEPVMGAVFLNLAQHPWTKQ